ncbi:MAG: UDP-N-acetylmuramoyl-tripeptide--D-alanyl-D-alanine ligase [Bdellovibrionales bacterium]
MKKWQLSLADALSGTGGQTDFGGSVSAVHFSGIGTDTRKSLAGQLFVALKGDRFDAHDFLPAAIEAGASGLLVHQDIKHLKVPAAVVVIRVSDTLHALQSLAHAWRRRCGFKVVGITGSNGKTSTKEFTRTILENHFKVHASQGSFNNHWGVPISLLAASPEDEVVVQEMGMNHSGELTELTRIAQPDISVVTMVGRSHIGEVGSQEAVADAKEELYLTAPQAIQIFNLDNHWTIPMLQRARQRRQAKRIMTFSSFREADVQMRVERLADFALEISGKIGGREGRATVSVVGRHNVVNLMAAASIAYALGMKAEEIWREMPRCRGAWGRNQVVDLKSGAKVLFDGYNANPESMTALLKNLFEIEVSGQKVVVLGEMMELGHESAKAHREIGELVARSGFDVVWFMGPHKADFQAGMEAEGFSKTFFVSDGYEESLARKVGSMLNPSDIAVVKGSRAMKMEQVLQQWQPINFTVYGSSSNRL